MDLSRLHRSEYVGFIGAAILALSLFLPWYSTDLANKNSVINGHTGEVTPWQTFAGPLPYLLLAACIAPFILAYIIARGNELSWRPGEITMIVGMVAFALILINGVIFGKPGDVPDTVSFEYGWFVGLVGAILIMAGGFTRQASGGRNRKPPGSVN